MPKNIPTEMYISKNAIAENPEHLTAAKRAFIVTGKHGAKASGALSDVTAVLDGAGIPYSVFDGVTENPSVGSAYLAGNEARAFGAARSMLQRRSRRLQKMNLHSPRIYSILRYA